MSEEVVSQEPSTQQAPSTEPASEPSQTLEQVFESFNVGDQPAHTQQFVPQPTSAPEQPKVDLPHIPDAALDPEGFRRYEASRVAESQALRQNLKSVQDAMTALQFAEAKRREDADIGKAVAFLKEAAPEIEDDFLEVYLGHQARKEPRLLNVWNNRAQNPKAWNSALKAIRNGIAGKFAMKQDPQLAENQRAMKAAQSGMATASKEPSVDEKLAKLSGAAFDRAMDRIRQGMDPGV